MHIPFNKPFYGQAEAANLQKALQNGRLSGDGEFTRACHQWLARQFGFERALLTGSCTAALEMAALLACIGPGDEVILPSYTFTSTANAFLLRGATVRLCDSQPGHPNIDLQQAAKLVSPRTKALVLVHYAGMACQMEQAQQLCQRHGLWLVEDAAQAFNSFYLGQPLGSFADFAAFSFHDTKNVCAGEGGLLLVKDQALLPLASSMRDKGTNRADFLQGKADAYEWTSTGSSFLPSEMTAAVLHAQFGKLPEIERRRQYIWQRYQEAAAPLQQAGLAMLPQVPEGACHNASIFYLMFCSHQARQQATRWLHGHGVQANFHYTALHLSQFGQQIARKSHLPNAARFSRCLLRLPLYPELNEVEIDYISQLLQKMLHEIPAC